MRTYGFSLRLSHMSHDEVELEKIVKSRFHYDQLASPLVSYMSRNSPSSSLWLVSPCLQCSMFPRPPTHSSLFLPSSKCVLVCLRGATFPNSLALSSLFPPSNDTVLVCYVPH